MRMLNIGNRISEQYVLESLEPAKLSHLSEFSKSRFILPLDFAAACGNGDVVKYLLTRFVCLTVYFNKYFLKFLNLRMYAKAIVKSSFCLLVQRDLQITMNLLKVAETLT
ncbi:hypothetical protein HK096_011442 [Nowakowskiella sp. JEL0078]|nr:hypothetical protein HK096_011442 [Nowakowskiella sp. JEL0078]